MIKYGTPKEFNNYVRVNNDVSIMLSQLGFMPEYRDKNWVYFVKKDVMKDLSKVLSKGEH